MTKPILTVIANGKPCEHRHLTIRAAQNCYRMQLRALGLTQSPDSKTVHIQPIKIGERA